MRDFREFMMVVSSDNDPPQVHLHFDNQTQMIMWLRWYAIECRKAAARPKPAPVQPMVEIEVPNYTTDGMSVKRIRLAKKLNGNVSNTRR